MPRPIFDQIITANALIEGDVIYFTASDTWTREIQEAEVFSDETIAQVRLIDAMAQANVSIGAYLMSVQQSPKGISTTHFREDFRTKGPSNYFHGKQEQQHV
jgi:hypothetical protein